MEFFRNLFGRRREEPREAPASKPAARPAASLRIRGLENPENRSAQSQTRPHSAPTSRTDDPILNPALSPLYMDASRSSRDDTSDVTHTAPAASPISHNDSGGGGGSSSSDGGSAGGDCYIQPEEAAHPYRKALLPF